MSLYSQQLLQGKQSPHYNLYILLKLRIAEYSELILKISSLYSYPCASVSEKQ